MQKVASNMLFNYPRVIANVYLSRIGDFRQLYPRNHWLDRD